ncbi:MAG TPA: FecR family protein, partial [Candidatus Binatia bacterium]|nr:FecR family protein [Candidatus Binatia bacterium]
MPAVSGAERRAGDTGTNGVVILEIAGAAEVLAVGQAAWKQAVVNQVLKNGDRFRTRKNSRATVRLSDLSQLRVGELSEFQVRRDPEANAPPIYKLWRGVIYFLHRDKPGRFRFDTPIASAAVRGTEFTLRVEDTDRTILTLFDGEVELSSDEGRVGVKSGEQAVAERGKAPAATAVVQAQLKETVQWALYYPAVLHLDEIRLSADDQSALGASLAAYRTGDLLVALAQFPADRQATSDAERVYRAGLLLAVGQVEQAEAMVNALQDDRQQPPDLPSARRLGISLRRLIAMVKGQEVETNFTAASATEWVVESYVRQARLDLPGALAAARKAVSVATNFSFGWARVAELDFGFGESRKALEEIDRALA